MWFLAKAVAWPCRHGLIIPLSRSSGARFLPPSHHGENQARTTTRQTSCGRNDFGFWIFNFGLEEPVFRCFGVSVFQCFSKSRAKGAVRSDRFFRLHRNTIFPWCLGGASIYQISAFSFQLSAFPQYRHTVHSALTPWRQLIFLPSQFLRG